MLDTDTLGRSACAWCGGPTFRSEGIHGYCEAVRCFPWQGHARPAEGAWVELFHPAAVDP
jgi:hypothetical protein